MKLRIGALLCALAVLAVAPAARAEDPPFADWTSLLPPNGTLAHVPTSEDECEAGRLSCVDKVIRIMTRRFDALAATCDHDAVFALTYLRTTEEYRRAATTAGFFRDPAFVNHEDAVFAAYYFRALDDHRAGRLDAVPAAWRVAFDAARDRAVSAGGNVMLGMNAHINRDLPYVLAGIGLVAPDGTSRKPDHDRVNEFLNRVGDAVFAEIARRFDPTIDDGDVEKTTADDFAAFQMVPAWREQAWRNAERLVSAATAAERALVEQGIESAALAEARSIRDATAYKPLLGQSSAPRDAFCAQHGAGA